MIAALVPLLAQQPAPEFRVDVDVVNLLATVQDSRGAPVSGLTREDFRLEEEGIPQQIRYFARQSEQPLTIGLLIDTSFSQRRLLDGERAAARALFGTLLRPDQDQAFVVSFDVAARLLSPASGSPERLNAALAMLRAPRSQTEYPRSRAPKPTSGTRLYDAVELASKEVLRGRGGRKALVVISDGVDNGSTATLDEAIRHAQQADAVIFGIRYFDALAYGPLEGRATSGPSNQGVPQLTRLTNDTGGRLLEAGDDLPSAFRRLEAELRNQYSIGYVPEPAAAKGYRRIRLTVTRPDLEVRTREGYYRSNP